MTAAVKTISTIAVMLVLSISLIMPSVAEAKSPGSKGKNKNNSKKNNKKKNKGSGNSPASAASKIARTSLVKDAAKRLAGSTAKYLIAKEQLRQVEAERENMFRDARSPGGHVSGESLKAMERRVSEARRHVINAQRARDLYKNMIRLMTEQKKIMRF